MSIFKAYDIRGIYKENLSKKDAYLIGFYVVKYLNLNTIKIAHDKRLSYNSLTKYLIQGIIDADSNVEYLGFSSTPQFYYSLFEGINSGIMVTASHNSKEYNGFKIMNNLESFDSRNGLYELEKVIKSDEFNLNSKFEEIDKELKNISLNKLLSNLNIKTQDYLLSYTNFISKIYENILSLEEKEILEQINFSLDFSSGMSSQAIIPFLSKTNLKYTLINEKIDGTFPIHSPDPLKAKDFLKTQNSLGNFTATFDGDGDRIVFYDENKNLILTDYIIAILIDFFSDLNHQNFVCDLRASRIISDIARKKNLNLELLRVGRAFYKEFMDNNSCIFGAELSGHLFFKDFHNLDNPEIALIYVLKIYALELLKNKTTKFSELFKKYKKYFKVEELNLSVKDPDEAIETLKEKYNSNIVSTTDGVSFDIGDFWFNIRKSNTENILRINLEGINEEICLDELKKLKELLLNIF